MSDRTGHDSDSATTEETPPANGQSVEPAATETVPETSAPTVERPRAPSPSTDAPGTGAPSTDVVSLRERYEDADPAFRAAFWKLVALYKVGIVGLAVGLLLVGFDTAASAGRPLAGGGAILLGYALWQTRRVQADIDDGVYDFADSDETTAPDAAPSGPQRDDQPDGEHV